MYYPNNRQHRGVCFVLFLTFRFRFAAVCRAGELALSIEPAPPHKLGDTVTITCTTPVRSALDMSKIVRSVEGQDFTITKKGHLEDFYQQQGRYEILEFKPEAGEVQLKITGVIN